MAVNAAARADRVIVKRQHHEALHENLVAQHTEQFKVNQKAVWENRTDGVIRENRVKTKVAAMEDQRKASLMERRQRLAKLLSEEQKAYEQELIDLEETPTQRMEKMAVRAYELKKRREDERQAMVQSRLYQQWREGIDELRTMDSQIVQLRAIAQRDHQLHEKQLQQDEEKEYDRVFDELWHQGYLAKVEREEREKKLKAERTGEQRATLGMQLSMKAAKLNEDREGEAREVQALRQLWDQQTQEERDAIVRERVQAKEERLKADAYLAVQKANRDREQAEIAAQDKAFVDGVLSRERQIAEKEAFEKEKAKRKAVEYTEALKLEMARKAESEERLVKLQQEEAERQWQKRYAQWEKEEMARRTLMEEVYSDRAEQVRIKQGMREKLKGEVGQDRDRIDAEVDRLDRIEKEREIGEKMLQQRHQEELFRQMDYHQLQKHRQLQQHAIEQRQAAIAEEKIRRAVAAEKRKAEGIMQQVLDGRKAAQRERSVGVVPPWEK